MNSLPVGLFWDENSHWLANSSTKNSLTNSGTSASVIPAALS